MGNFRLTEQHLLLLSKTYWNWQDTEFGAPEVDPKRPYGNSNVLHDIRTILKSKEAVCPECGAFFDEDQEQKLNQLHQELKPALEYICSRLTDPAVKKVLLTKKKED